MRILVTAGPTREHIDAVRFITNASSGRMGCAVAAAAQAGGHDVTLLLGAGVCDSLVPPGARTARFVTVADLSAALAEHFPACDGLVMAAGVGDFTVADPSPGKLRRSAGAINVRLEPTDDVLASVTAEARADQIIIAFAVEDAPPDAAQQRARQKLSAKRAHYIVVNTAAAMASDQSTACILSSDAVVLDWARRPKDQLADEIVKLLEVRSR